MVTDGQVKELRRLLGTGKTLAAAARMTEMSENTARQYRDDQRLPSDTKVEARLSNPAEIPLPKFGPTCKSGWPKNQA